MLSMDANVMRNPEVFVGGAAGEFDSTGACTDDGTRASVATYMAAFGRWAAMVQAINAGDLKEQWVKM
jgi:hypothetical protein